MDVTYQLTANDFVQAIRHGKLETKLERWWNFLFYPGLAAAVIADKFVTLKTVLIESLIIFFVGLIVILIRLIRSSRAGRARFTNDPSAQGPISLNVSSDGLSFQGPASPDNVSWDHYLRWHETTKQFVLFPSLGTFVIVPKRAFTSEQVDQFRGYLHNYISAREPLPLNAPWFGPGASPRDRPKFL